MTKEIDKARINPSKRLQPNTGDLIIPKKKKKAGFMLIVTIWRVKK